MMMVFVEFKSEPSLMAHDGLSRGGSIRATNLRVVSDQRVEQSGMDGGEQFSEYLVGTSKQQL